MDKLSVLVICAIFSVFFVVGTIAANPSVGCCPFSGTQGFGVYGPPDVTIECHATTRNDFRASTAFAGYGYRASGCPSLPGCANTCFGHDGTQYVLTPDGGNRVIFTPSTEIYSQSCGGGSGAGVYRRQFCGGTCPANGNTICSGDQVVTVQDTTAPVLGVPGTVNLECGLNNYAANTERPESGFANYYDQCTPHNNLVFAISDSSGSNLCGSGLTPVITRTYTVTDRCGNSVSDTQIINIVDTIPPILRGVFDETVEFGIPPVSNPTGEDNCTPIPSLSIVQSSFVYPGRCTTESTTERVYVVTDLCGNSRRYSSILTVQDTLAPTCQDGGNPVTSQDFTVACNNYPPPLPTITCTDASGAITPVRDDYETFQLLDPDNDDSREALDRTLVRNYTATDSCGNTLNWVYRYHIQQVSTINYVTGTSVTILPGKTGTVTFSFNLLNCFLRGARLHYDVYPLVLTGVGSGVCQEPSGRMVVGDSYCRINNPGVLPSLISVSVEVYVPLTFEQDKLTVRFELTALNQLDVSSGAYGEVIIHTA